MVPPSQSRWGLREVFRTSVHTQLVLSDVSHFELGVHSLPIDLLDLSAQRSISSLIPIALTSSQGSAVKSHWSGVQ